MREVSRRYDDGPPARTRGGCPAASGSASRWPRALMNRPAILLADEPTGALDTAAGQAVRRLLSEVNAEGQTIVVITHDLALARSCTNRTVRIADGRITEDVSSQAVAPEAVR